MKIDRRSQMTKLTSKSLVTLIILSASLLASSQDLSDETLAAIVTIILGGSDYETDSDGDGIPDIEDAFPDNPKENKDTDGDGVGDNSDVFPTDASKSNSVVINFAGGNVSSIALNTDAVSLGTNGSRLDGSLNTEDDSDNNNIIGYDEDGNEVENAVETSAVLFVAESVLSPDGEFLYLLTSPHLQRALDLPQEVCSLYRIELSSEAVDCLVNDAGDVRPKVLNEYAIFSAARKGIDFRADGTAVVFGLNYNRNLPEGISGGTQSGYAWVLSTTGELTGIEPSENFFVWDALWLDDTYIALFEHRYFELWEQEGNKRQIRLVDAATLQDAESSPVAIDYSASFARSPVGLMLAGATLKKSDFSLTSRGYEEKLIEDASGRFFGLTDGSFRLIAEDGSGYALEDNSEDYTLTLEASEPGAASPNWQKQSGTGTDVKYTQVSSDAEFFLHTKGFKARTPIIAVEGNEWPETENLLFSKNDDVVTISAGGAPSSPWWGVHTASELDDDLTISYTVELSSDSSENRTLTIPANAINAWLAATDKPGCEAGMESCLNWANPEPDEEGFCLHKYGTEPYQNRCIQFNQSDNPSYQYKVLTHDMESLRATRFDDDEIYPGGTGNAFPGVQTVALIDGRLQAYFKDSRDHQYYLAVADANAFWENGESALLFASAQNGAGDNVIITEATSLTLPAPLPLAGVTVGAERIEDSVIVSVTLPAITEAQSYEFNLFADTPSVTVSALNSSVNLDAVAEPEISAANTLSAEYAAEDFESGQIYVAALPEHFLVNGSIRRRTPGAQLLFVAP